MGRPFVAILIAYGVGLLAAWWLQPPLAWLFGGTGLLLAAALLWQRARPILIWPLLALVCWTNFAACTDIVSPNDLRTLLGHDPAIATIRGRLLETPRLKIRLQHAVETWHGVARVEVTEIRRGDAWQPAVGTVLVATPSLPGPQYFTGQPVEVSGVIAPPSPALAPGLFDYRDYLQTRGIYYQLKAASWNDWAVREPHLAQPPLSDRFLAWSKDTLALGLPGEDESLRLLWAMTLDWRTAFAGDISEPFLRAGTFHLFAIDGLRIALLAGMIVTLLRALRLSRAWCGLVAVPVIWFYTAATGWEASAIRASVMMTVVLGGWALKRPGDLLNSLAAAAFILLLWQPRQFLEAGFQLSFCVVLVIAVMLKPLDDRCARLFAPDPLLPESLRPRWQQWLVRALRQVARYGTMSFTAWIGSLPLCAKYFHLFNPVSTFANLIAVPLGTLALIANLGALLCGHWLASVTILFNYAAWAAMLAMTWVSVAAAKIPGAYWYVSAPPVAGIVLYYAVILAGFSGWFTTARRKQLGAAALLVIALGVFWQWQSARSITTLTVLPLNGAHAVLVQGAGGHNDWLINAGNDEAVDSTVKPFLRAQGINHIPRLILTEGSAISAGGTPQLNELFGIGELWTSGVNFRSPEYRRAVAAVAPARHKIMAAGDTNGCWRVLYPPADAAYARADDSTLVLRGEFPGLRVLLLSALSRAGQDALLSRTNDLSADIVVAGLPTEGEPLCAALLQAIHPRVIIIADAEFPASRRAKPALQKRLAATCLPVIYTRTAGAATITTDGHGWQLETMDGQRVRQELVKDN